MRTAETRVARDQASATPPLFPDSVVVRYESLRIELMVDGARRHPERLETIRDDVLEVAARSRGWVERAEIEAFREVFKIDSLFRTDALALIWSGGHVIGLAGTARETGPAGELILHLCSLGLRAQAQRQGLLSVLFALLWDVQQAWPGTADAYLRGQVYLTAITQSPLIMAFLGRVSDMFPGPDATVPDHAMIDLGSHVIDRFEPTVTFDPASFVLRNECLFGYRTIPYSTDSRVNAYCDGRLRYQEGDTFLLVGRARPEAVQAFIERSYESRPALMREMRAALITAHPELAWVRR
jgi:hypothetical protein